METATIRRSQKIFIQMSMAVKTRNADQCRSHHQKIIKYHNTIEEAIEFFSGRLGQCPLSTTQKQKEGTLKVEFGSEAARSEIGELSLMRHGN